MGKTKNPRLHVTIDNEIYTELQKAKKLDSETDSSLVTRHLQYGISASNFFDQINSGIRSLFETLDDLKKHIKKLRESDFVTKETEAQIKRAIGDQMGTLRSRIDGISETVTVALQEVVPLFSAIEALNQKIVERQDHFTKIIVQFSEGLQRLQNTIIKGAQA